MGHDYFAEPPLTLNSSSEHQLLNTLHDYFNRKDV